MGNLSTPKSVQTLQKASHAKAWCLVREPDAGDLHVRFDERDVETGLWRGYLGTVRRKRRQQTSQTYCYRATSRLYRNRQFVQRQRPAPYRMNRTSERATGRTAKEKSRSLHRTRFNSIDHWPQVRIPIRTPCSMQGRGERQAGWPSGNTPAAGNPFPCLRPFRCGPASRARMRRS